MKWLGAAAAALILAFAPAAPPAGAAKRNSARLDVYTGVVGVERAEDERISVPEDIFGVPELPDIAVAEREQYTTMAVRDLLNEGGKLIHAAETAQYSGLIGDGVGGLYYGLNGAPEAECVISSGPGLFRGLRLPGV